MRISSIFIFFLVVALYGCKSDKNGVREIVEEDLIGEWVIFYATRNGKMTKSLEEGNFVFQDDNLVSSNLFNSSNSLNFTYDKGTINIEGDSLMSYLKVKKLKNDTLVLSSKMKVFEMEFYLSRQ
ncbi:MAG: hypothetical protein P1U56_19935 [Saprospiraceae bacterium]|nr:hypothetical protein [Saprospiraceae bacterium]